MLVLYFYSNKENLKNINFKYLTKHLKLRAKKSIALYKGQREYLSNFIKKIIFIFSLNSYLN